MGHGHFITSFTSYIIFFAQSYVTLPEISCVYSALCTVQNTYNIMYQIASNLDNNTGLLLGLLFFNELSQTIVDEIVAQQLSIMSGSKIRDLLSVLDPQVVHYVQVQDQRPPFSPRPSYSPFCLGSSSGTFYPP